MTTRDISRDSPRGHKVALVSEPRQARDGKITARAVAAPESTWFSGHFPAEAVLPGIAQLAVVIEALRSVSGPRLRVCGLRRVRFRQIVRPNDRMDISMAPTEGDRQGYAFRVSVGGEVVCSGTLYVV